MTEEDFDYRVRICRLFIPLGLAVYGYYCFHSLTRNAYWFTAAAASGFFTLGITGILLIRKDHPQVRRHIHRFFAAYARTVLVLMGLSQFLSLSTYTRLEHLPWAFIFPLMAIVLRGNKEAALWVVVHALLMFPWLTGLWPGIRSDDDVSNGVAVLVAYIAIYLCITIIESARTRSLNTILKQKAQLEESLGKLDTARILAENANAAKSRFLANVSHELRTPLNHIIGFTELVADAKFGQVNETQKEYLRNALSSSEHLLAMIDNILDLSTIETGTRKLKISEIHSESFIHDAVLMLSDFAAANKVQITVEIENAPEIIHADHRMMNQVMYNLLSNAIQFSPGGSVSVHASGNPSAGVFEVSVIDTGIGIEPANLHRIFQPFERITDTDNQQVRGTGLGLSIAKEIMELHQGSLSAHSNGKGKGSVFTFSIPADLSLRKS